jgi:alpha/beta superfamily hydrolase
MSETSLMIPVGDFALEARHAPGDGERSAVICHPHPQYGGSMENNVVHAARDALGAQGFGTLRFNFRGVGQSGGQHDGGDGEAGDLVQVVADLAQRDGAAVHVAAYSFGARVAVQACSHHGLAPASLMLFSPPVDFMDFADLRLPGCDTLIVIGDRDEFCALSSLDRWLNGLPEARYEKVVLRGGDHFYWGQETALKSAITDFVG